jgi:hypothetical protein
MSTSPDPRPAPRPASDFAVTRRELLADDATSCEAVEVPPENQRHVVRETFVQHYMLDGCGRLAGRKGALRLLTRYVQDVSPIESRRVDRSIRPTPADASGRDLVEKTETVTRTMLVDPVTGAVVAAGEETATAKARVRVTTRPGGAA